MNAFQKQHFREILSSAAAAIAILGLLIFVSGCAMTGVKDSVNALNSTQAVGSPFTRNLTNGYRDFANREMNQMFDFGDARHFAQKGLKAARGDVVLPEPIDSWHLMPQHMEELGAQRNRLLAALDLGGREIAPEEAAKAQVKFDCWIEQQEENWQTDDILTCKKQFMDAMSILDGVMTPKPVGTDVQTYAPVGAAAPMKAEDAMYLVFFDFDSDRIGSGGYQVIDAVAKEINSRRLNGVNIVGHADRSGPESYNEKLSRRRAEAIRDALIQRGVPAQLINVSGRGENDMLVKTQDGVREPANRRAEITFM